MSELIYPPPMWAKTDNPVWLDWFTLLVNFSAQNAESLQAGLVSGSYVSGTKSGLATYPASPTSCLPINYTSNGGALIILFSGYYNAWLTGEVHIYLYRDSTELIHLPEYVFQTQNEAMFICYAEQPAAGTYTYSLRASGDSLGFPAFDSVKGRLIVLEIL